MNRKVKFGLVTLAGLVVLFGTGCDKLKSVSYTHLRAHETVLDLVCRLLLEKKKKTHYMIKMYE